VRELPTTEVAYLYNTLFITSIAVPVQFLTVKHATLQEMTAVPAVLLGFLNGFCCNLTSLY
jgi:hypothetical protein